MDGSPACSSGLTAQQVRERLEAGLTNDVPRRSSRSVGEIVRANVLTRFNALIGSMFALVLVFGPWQDGLFGGIIVANSAIGVIQELRAKRTLDRLAVVGQTPVRIRRGGEVCELPQQQIVLDDLIVLAPGDRVVVDGAVTTSSGLEVDESLLTGEADPVHKAIGEEVRSGSFVVSGSGEFTATKVGRRAYAARLEEEASRFSLTRSELMTGINRFLRYVTWVVVPTAILLFVSQFSSAGHVSAAVVGAVAGVVTMVPEGLVLMTSVAFAVGVVRLGRRQCLVQELPAIEGLARVDVLCVDKTGTLTEPGLELAEIVPLRQDVPVRPALAALTAGDPHPNATARAVAEGLGAADPGWAVTATVPFSSTRKWSGAEFAGHGAWALGAADVLLNPEDPGRQQAETLGATGARVLALATVPTGLLTRANQANDVDDDGGPDATGSVRPAALVVLRQRLRADATSTLRYFAEQGVAVKVISGDNPVSVGAIAHTLGLPGAEAPVDARTMPEDPDGMADLLDAHSVFGRVSPRQKRAMVTALQLRGHTVAMTGDGVNDVLAIKDADLGISMGSGSSATRAVAQVVLLDNSFASLPHVVAEGRRVLGNIERVANLFLTKTVYSILLSVLVGLLHVRFPFLPRHLTLISTLTIGVPAFFLALAPNTDRARPGFVPRVLRFAVPAGICCGAATFTGYYLATRTPGTTFEDDSSTASFALFLLALWVLALVAHPWNGWRLGLVAAMGGSFLVVLALPWLRTFFALRPANLLHDVTALAIAGLTIAGLTLLLRCDAWLTRRLRHSPDDGGSGAPRIVPRS